MDKRAQENIDYAKLCGFELDGLDGHGHYIMTHPNGATMRVAATPGDYRGDNNNRALARRLSGVTPNVGKRAGRFSRGVRLEDFVPSDERVESVSARFSRLAGAHRELCDRIDACTSASEARPIVSELLDVEQQITDLGRTLPCGGSESG